MKEDNNQISFFSVELLVHNYQVHLHLNLQKNQIKYVFQEMKTIKKKKKNLEQSFQLIVQEKEDLSFVFQPLQIFLPFDEFFYIFRSIVFVFELENSSNVL